MFCLISLLNWLEEIVSLTSAQGQLLHYWLVLLSITRLFIRVIFFLNVFLNEVSYSITTRLDKNTDDVEINLDCYQEAVIKFFRCKFYVYLSTY